MDHATSPVPGHERLIESRQLRMMARRRARWRAAPRAWGGGSSERAKRVRCIVRDYDPQSVGTTERCAYRRTPATDNALAEKLRNDHIAALVRLTDEAGKVPTRKVPDWALRLFAAWNPRLWSVVPDLGKIRQSSNAKASGFSNWSPPVQ